MTDIRVDLGRKVRSEKREELSLSPRDLSLPRLLRSSYRRSRGSIEAFVELPRVTIPLGIGANKIILL